MDAIDCNNQGERYPSSTRIARRITGVSKPRENVQRHTLRSAIYTCRSSEEGLEQEFNSLHAQRE